MAAPGSPETIHVVLTTWEAVLAQTGPANPGLPTPAATEIHLWETITSSGPISFAALILLIVFSVVSWAIMVHKYFVLRRASRQSDKFLDAFWAAKRLDQMYQQSDHFGGSPIAQVFRAGYIELARLKKHSGEDELGGGIENV